MTVQELENMLSEFPPDAEVLFLRNQDNLLADRVQVKFDGRFDSVCVVPIIN